MAGLEAYRSRRGHESYRPSSWRRGGKEFRGQAPLYPLGGAGEEDPKK